MALADVLKSLLAAPEGIGKTALVVGRTHTHVKNQLVPIFDKILSKKDARGKEIGVGQSAYSVTKSAPMTMKLPFGSKIIFWSLEACMRAVGMPESSATSTFCE